MGKKFNRLNQEEYDRIKTLLGIVSRKQAVLFTGRSSNTIRNIDVSVNMEGYLAHVRSTMDKSRKSRAIANHAILSAPVVQEMLELVSPDDAPESLSEVQLVTTSDDNLGRIADALERLASAWEASPKKGMFR